MLITENLFGEKIDKVEIAIETLRMYEPEEGYYLAFSGGKDSITIYNLALKAGVKFDAHYNVTTVDPPELIKFMKRNYPDVNFDKPEISMFRLIVREGMPPTQLMRFCCKWLKERGGEGRRVITGVRWAESQNRQNRRTVESCYQGHDKVYINPIIDWEDTEVWQFIKQEGLEYPRLYDEGYSRIGCILCPYKGKKGMIQDKQRWPRYYKAYVKAFDRMLRERERRGLETNWQTGEEVAQWWIYRPPKKEHPTIFE